jgi:hypothetical protein
MLQSVAFSSFFPRDYDSSYCVRKNIPDPWEAVDKINKWRDSGKPVKLLITETDINMYARGTLNASKNRIRAGSLEMYTLILNLKNSNS